MKKYALIGHNIAYSLSPKIHALIYEFFGMSDCKYQLLDMDAAQLNRDFAGLAKEYCGFNVTIPHKIAAAEFVTKNLSPIKPINTIAIDGTQITGYNTDTDGFKQSFGGIEGSDILLIGAGGAAESVAYALQSSNNRLCIKARNSDKSARLTKRYNLQANYVGFSPEVVINASGKNILDDDLLLDIDTTRLKTVFDMSYCYQNLKSVLARRKISYISGLDMLIYQAIFAADHLYGIGASEHISQLFAHIKRGLEEA